MVVPVGSVSTHLLIPCLINGYEVDFHLDTGSNITGINNDDADKRHVRASAETSDVGDARLHRANFTMSVNGAPIQRVHGLIWHSTNVLNWTDAAVNWDILITSDGMTMRRHPTHSVEGVARPDGSSPNIIVNCMVNGHAVPFLLDTGAYATNINVNTANELGLRMEKEPLEGLFPGEDLTGLSDRATIKLSIKGGPIQRTDVKVDYRPNLLSWRDVTEYWNIQINENGLQLVDKNPRTVKKQEDYITPILIVIGLIGMYYLFK
jgi:hypothetical protein